MREIVWCFRAISLVVFSALPLFSTLQGTMPLSFPLNQADEVLVATITRSAEGVNSGSLDLFVQRTLRGFAKAGSTVVVNYTTTSSGMVGVPEKRIDTFRGITSIWFVKHVGGASSLLSRTANPTSLVDIYLPVPAEQSGAQYAYDAETDVRKKLLLEMEAAALNPLTSRTISKLWASLIVDDFGKELLQPMYARLAASPDVSIRAMGVAGQLRLGVPLALAAMVDVNPRTLPENLQAVIERGVCNFRGTDPAAIAQLAALLDSAFSPQTKTCAVYALREIHTRESLPILAKLLNSDAPDVRYNALIGIAQYAMSFPTAGIGEKPGMMATYRGDNSALHREMAEHYPVISLFTGNEEYYLSYWKAYLANQGAQ